MLRLILLAVALVALMPWASLAGKPSGLSAVDAGRTTVADADDAPVIAAPVRCAKGKVIPCAAEPVALPRQTVMVSPVREAALWPQRSEALPVGQADPPRLPPPRSA